MRTVKSRIAEAIQFKIHSPVAVILTDARPEEAVQFSEDRWGCVAAMLVTASKGRTAVFDRKTYGCVGGAVGLGFGDQYRRSHFPIDALLSTGNGTDYRDRGHRSYLTEGERYYRTPELARKFVEALPMRDVPTGFVVFKPLEQVADEDRPALVIFLADADQLSALMVLANYNRARNDNVIAPFGAGCQSILYGLAEAERPTPRGIIGFTDISARKYVGKDILSFTVPWSLYLEMERNVEGSFLEKEQWEALERKREGRLRNAD